MPLYHDKWKSFLTESVDPILTEDQILAEGRLEDVKKKFEEFAERGIIDRFAENDPSGNNAYLAWMAKKLSDFYSMTRGVDSKTEQMVMRQEHIEMIISLTRQFHQNKQRLEKKDIYQYKAIEDLKDALDDLGQTRSQKRKFEKEKAMEGSEIIHEDENFFAIRPFTTQASCHYGANSKWCISARGNGYFDNYTSEGKGFVFVRLNNMVDSEDNEREFALVYDRDGELETTFDIEDVEGDDEAFHDAAAVNILEGIFDGTKYAGKGREMYGEIYSDMNTALEDKPAPGIYKAIAKEIEKQYGDTGSFEDIDIDEAELYELSDWIMSSIRTPGYEIIHAGTYSIEQTPPGPSIEALDAIVERFRGEAQHSNLDYYMDEHLSFNGGMSISFDDFPLDEWSEKVQDEYDDYRSETEDSLRAIATDAMEAGGIYPDHMEISWERQWNRETGSYDTGTGSEVLTLRLDFHVEYEDPSVQGFQSYADRILEYDANVDNVKETMTNKFIKALMIKSDAYTSIEQAKANTLAELDNFDEAEVGDGEITFYGTLQAQVARVPLFIQELSREVGTQKNPGRLAWFREEVTGPFRNEDETILKFYMNQITKELNDFNVDREWRMMFGRMLNKVYDSQEDEASRQGRLALQEENLYQSADFSFNVVKGQRVYHPPSGKMTIVFYIEIPIRDQKIETGIRFVKDVDRLWRSVETVYEGVVNKHMEEFYDTLEDGIKAKLNAAKAEREKTLSAKDQGPSGEEEGWEPGAPTPGSTVTESRKTRFSKWRNFLAG